MGQRFYFNSTANRYVPMPSKWAVHYVFNCRSTDGRAFAVPTEALARVAAWVLTKLTGDFHDYWHTPEGV